MDSSRNSIEYYAHKYSTMLARIAFTYLKNTYDAEDIVQEVFLKLMIKKPVFENDNHEKAWLIRVTINLSINYTKAIHKRHAELDENLSYISEKNWDLIQAVLNLPPKYKAIIYLYYYEGYSIKEIASMLAKSPGTVGTRLSRGRKLLKDVLIEEVAE